MKYSWLFVCGLAGFLGSSCATELYGGPRKPDSELVYIKTDGTKIVAIDGRLIHGASGTFVVLPGIHGVAALLNDTQYGYVTSRKYSLEPITLCFKGYAGHAYFVRPRYDGRLWKPEVMEAKTTELIPVRRIFGRSRDCQLPPPEAENDQ